MPAAASTFDFDTPARVTNTAKWRFYEGRDVIAMTVADMEFACAPAIVEALHDRVRDANFGYAAAPKSTVEAIVNAVSRYGWKIDADWVIFLPGAVAGLDACARTFAQPGEHVLLTSPYYPPIFNTPNVTGRVARDVPLVQEVGGKYQLDFDALEAAVTPATRFFVNCNPHNPISRVWNRDELSQLADFCLRHTLLICSDEIHCDLILDEGKQHVPIATISPEIARKTVTLLSASKTWNLAGLSTAVAIIPDGELRKQFVLTTEHRIPLVSPFGYAACEAAYTRGEPWRQALLPYLRENRELLIRTLKADIPNIRFDAPHEATYLAFLNIEAMGVSSTDAVKHFEAHGVGVFDGAMFGSPRHVRLNFGCPRTMLVEALRRLAAAARSEYKSA